jgi:hypothetical protein
MAAARVRRCNAWCEVCPPFVCVRACCLLSPAQSLKMMAFQEAKRHTSRDWKTELEVAEERLQNLALVTGTNSPTEGNAPYQTALEHAKEDGIDLKPMEKVDFWLKSEFHFARVR